MIAKEGYTTIIVVIATSILLGWIATYLPGAWLQNSVFVVLLILCLLIIFFFRDPERSLPQDQNIVISPADGKVVLIQETEENEYIGGKVTQVSIFLSPLDVHVNRCPVAGKLEYVRYYPGKYLMAWEDHASEENERAHFGVTHPGGTKFMFKQITGFLARRIVYHIKEGDTIKAGQRFGIMKFGSRMDILLPDNIELKINQGDRTVAGESVIGIIK